MCPEKLRHQNYRERRKSNMSCFCVVESELKFSSACVASEPLLA